MPTYLSALHYVNGPYKRNKDGRYFVNTVSNEGIKRTISYPKFLVEVLLGRHLDPYEETIDHIDQDWTNNDWSNLRIIDLRSHIYEDIEHAALAQVNCAWCGEVFYRNVVNLRRSLHQHKVGPFCSRECAGSYSTALQYGKIDPAYYKRISLSPNAIKTKLYKLTKKSPTVLDVALSLNRKIYSEDEILLSLPRTKKRPRKNGSGIHKVHRAPVIEERSCPQCGIVYKNKNKYCSTACAQMAQRKVERPPKNELRNLVWKYPTKKLAERYGVSDAAVAKWCKRYGIAKPPRGYWARQNKRS